MSSSSSTAMRRFRPMLVQKMLRMVEHESYDVPKAWAVVTRYQPAELAVKHPRLPPAHYAHDALYRDFYRRFPAARAAAPYLLNSSRPALARRFVSRQLELLQADPKQSRADAFKAVCAEMRAELSALRRPLALVPGGGGGGTGGGGAAYGGYIGHVQAQEETVLRYCQAAKGSGGGGGGAKGGRRSGGRSNR